MEILNKYEENGYIITEYDNGCIIKELKTISNTFEETIPTEEESYKAKILNQLEYIACLGELGVMN